MGFVEDDAHPTDGRKLRAQATEEVVRNDGPTMTCLEALCIAHNADMRVGLDEANLPLPV